MKSAPLEEQTQQKPLRLWPGVVIVLLQWLVWMGLPKIVANAGPVAALGALAGGLAFVVWWVFFSRAPWSARLGALGVMVVAVVVTRPFLHESIAKAGMGFVFFLYVIPILCLAFLLWALVSRRLSVGPRRVAMVATIVLACGVWTLLRTAGVTGGGDWDFQWRWSETPEDRLVAQAEERAPALPALAPLMVGAEWPGFRGPHRDGKVTGVRINTDWTARPPEELWRRPIGPGWSSFAVRGDLLYTQEQRGDEETVSCYSATNGELVWRHSDTARFWESQAGAGPRATPTLQEDRVYTLGATGIVNALDARDGAVIWSRDAASDAGVRVPDWGFSGSPLVVEDQIIVHVGALVAYDLNTGDQRWVGPKSGSYSSPHLAVLYGAPQILMLSGAGAVSVEPSDGTVLWEHPWTGGIVQPAVTPEGDVLVSSTGMSGSLGLRRIAVAHGAAGWTAKERWTSNRLKPNFSDFVVHGGHAFGFDGRILACIDLEDGRRKWKGGRYGSGQLILLPDQDVLLVISEKGELALVSATPDQFDEVARFPAIEGKTWNHPVLVEDRLFVRNGQEMAAFRLPLAGG